MAKLSVEILESEEQIVNAQVFLEGTPGDLTICLGYLAQEVASSMGIPVHLLLGVVEMSIGKLQQAIQDETVIDRSAIEAAMEGGRGK